MGLSGKIIILILGILIIPGILVGSFFYLSYRDSLIVDADYILKKDLVEVTGKMEENLELMEETVKEIDYEQELVYFLDSQNKLSEREIDKFSMDMIAGWGNICERLPGKFSELTIFTDNREIEDIKTWRFKIQNIQEFGGFFYSRDNDGYMRYGIPQKIYDYEEEASDAKYDVVEDMTMSLPLYLYKQNLVTGKCIGVIELKMYIDKLIDGRRFKEDRGNNQILLLDRTGHILYQTGEFSNAEVKKYDFTKFTSVEEIILGNEPYRVIGSKCEKTNLIRAVLVPKRTVTGSATRMILSVGGLAIAAVITIISLTYVLLRRLLNRLIILDRALIDMGRGELYTLKKDEGYEDEISRIKESFNLMVQRLESAIELIIEKDKAKKDAEIKALQAQINPHFLYNTLESIRMQCELEGNYDVCDALTALGNLFRYAINWENETVRFSDEWANIKNYLVIMKSRLADDFYYDLLCQENVGNLKVSKMILQPLVENSFSHGFKGIEAPWYLRIDVTADKGHLYISIQNNGAKILPGRLRELRAMLERGENISRSSSGSNSLGIKNVLQRIKLIHGEHSKIEIDNLETAGVQVKITICMEEENVSFISGG